MSGSVYRTFGTRTISGVLLRYTFEFTLGATSSFITLSCPFYSKKHSLSNAERPLEFNKLLLCNGCSKELGSQAPVIFTLKGSYYLTGEESKELERLLTQALEYDARVPQFEEALMASTIVARLKPWLRAHRKDAQFQRTLQAAAYGLALLDAEKNNLN